MSKGIELSKKYGVNPTIPSCFWCGKPKNEIALMGRVSERDPQTGRRVRGSDIEAPMGIVLNYEPCDKCAEQWKQGFTVIEAAEHPYTEGQPPFQRGVYPSGRYLVVLNGKEKEMFDEKYTQKDKLFVCPEVFEQLIPKED